MIDTKIELKGDITSGLEKLDAKVREEVLVKGAAAGARVIYDEVKLNTSPPRMGMKTGNLHNAVYRTLSESRSDDSSKAYHVGVNKSKAPHWHLLEYGTSRMSARPYLRPAYDSKIQEAGEAAIERMKRAMKE